MTHKPGLSLRKNRYKAILYRKNTVLDLDLNLHIQIRDLGHWRKRKSTNTEIAAGKLPIHLDLGIVKTINIAIKDIETTENRPFTETIETEIVKDTETENIEGIIATETESTMTDGTEETEAGPEINLEMIENKRILNSKANLSPLRSQCQLKSLCLQFPHNEDNVVNVSAPVHHWATTEGTKTTTRANSGTHSHGCLESTTHRTFPHQPW